MRFSVHFIKYILLSICLMFSEQGIASPLKYFQTQYDTNWVVVGYGGMRGIGKGGLTLTKVSGTIIKAYLYWHGPTSSEDPNVNANVIFNGNNITGTNIGFSDPNFWPFKNSQAYRAEITSYITGNGEYNLSSFKKPDAEINGVSLVVFFDDGDKSNNVDVVLFDGNDSNIKNKFDPLGWDISLSGINYTSGSVLLLLGVSDGQSFGPKDDGSLKVNGSIVSEGGIFQGDSVSGGKGGVANGRLWDLLRVDISRFLIPGVNTLNMTMTQVQDALSAIHIGIQLPAGAAPNQPAVQLTEIPLSPAEASPYLTTFFQPCNLLFPVLILLLVVLLAFLWSVIRYLLDKRSFSK